MVSTVGGLSSIHCVVFNRLSSTAWFGPSSPPLLRAHLKATTMHAMLSPPMPCPCAKYRLPSNTFRSNHLKATTMHVMLSPPMPCVAFGSAVMHRSNISSAIDDSLTPA